MNDYNYLVVVDKQNKKNKDKDKNKDNLEEEIL